VQAPFEVRGRGMVGVHAHTALGRPGRLRGP
jgi:hypothetical protein